MILNISLNIKFVVKHLFFFNLLSIIMLIPNDFSTHGHVWAIRTMFKYVLKNWAKYILIYRKLKLSLLSYFISLHVLLLWASSTYQNKVMKRSLNNVVVIIYVKFKIYPFHLYLTKIIQICLKHCTHSRYMSMYLKSNL